MTQITLTNLQLKELAKNGIVQHSRVVGGFTISFNVVLDENRKPYVSTASIKSDALPLVAFPDMLVTGGIVPQPKK